MTYAGRREVVLGLWLWAAMAWAGGLQVHGWTTDGLFVHERVASQMVEGTEFPDFIEYVVVDVKDVSDQGVEHLELKQGEDGSIDRGAFDAWLTAHPLAGSKAARTGPKGTRLEAHVGPAAALGEYEPETAWHGSVFEAKVEMEGADAAEFRVGLSVGGEGFWELSRQPMQAGAFGGHVYTASAWFHPSEPYVAVVVDMGTLQTMRGPLEGRTQVFVVRTRPMVAVLAPSRLSSSLEATAASIAGLGTVSTGEAQKERTATVVYFAEGFRSDADAIAAKVSGTVEPLTWEAPQHIVVALGAP